MEKRYFDFREIFQVIRYGFSGRKIGVHLGGLVIGYLIYEILVYLSLFAIGVTAAGDFWGEHGLLPVLPFGNGELDSLTEIAMWIGGGGFVCVFFLASTVVSKITVEQLRGDFFFPIGEAFVFLRGRWKSVLGAFIGLLLLQMVLVLIPLSIAWIGKLPGVGTPFLLFTSLFLPVGFFLGVVIVLIAVIFGVSLFFVPAVVATTGADAFETIYQQFAIVWNVPWLTVCYEMILFLLKSIFVPIWAFFCIAGFSIVVFPISLLHTEEMRRALGSANLWVGGALERLAALPYINSLGIFDLSGTGPGTAAFDTMVPAIFLTITVFLGVGVVIAYLFSMVSAGNTIIYTILRKRIDGQNLVEPPDPEPQETSR